MKTSYFAKYKGNLGVNIAIKPAPGFKGTSYPPLFPKWSFLSQYKKDSDENSYTEAYYDQVLNKLDPMQILEEIGGNTLLCWEKSGTFCHRRIVAEWIFNETGVIVPEDHT